MSKRTDGPNHFNVSVMPKKESVAEPTLTERGNAEAKKSRIIEAFMIEISIKR